MSETIAMTPTERGHLGRGKKHKFAPRPRRKCRSCGKCRACLDHLSKPSKLTRRQVAVVRELLLSLGRD